MISIIKYGNKLDLSKIPALNGKKSLTLQELVLGNTIEIKIPKGTKFVSAINEADLRIEFKESDGTIFELILKDMAELLGKNDGTNLVNIIEIGENNNADTTLASISDLVTANAAAAAGPAGGTNTNSDSGVNPDSGTNNLNLNNGQNNNAGLPNGTIERVQEPATPATGTIPTNTAPIINPIADVNVDEDNNLIIPFTTSDEDNDILIYTVSATNGSAVINANGDIVFTPNADYNGNAQVTLSASDGAATTTQIINITVNPVNDTPVIEPILTQIVDEDQTKTITFTASDIDADTLSSSATASNGTVTITGNTITYVPNANFNGSDTINLIVNDGNGGTTTQVINVTVNPVNDAPVITTVAPRIATLSETDFGTLSGKENSYKIITEQEMFDLLGVTDADANDSLSLSLTTDSSAFSLNGTDVTSATNGVVQLTAADITGFGLTGKANVGDFFIYSLGFDSMDDGDSTEVTFEVKAYDGTVLSAGKTVNLTVTGTTDTTSGTGIDGYISNMTVFSDTDNDRVLDGTETSTNTNALGEFTLTGGNVNNTLVGFGGTDISTGLAFEGIYKAPEGSSILNPTTTILVDLMGEGKTLAEAKTIMYTKLSIDASVDLLSDPIAQAVNASSQADETNYINFQTVNAQINNTIGQIAAAIDGGNISDEKSAFNKASIELAKLLIAGPVDLTDTNQINTLLSNTISEIDNGLLSESVKTDVSQVIVNTNNAIASATNGVVNAEDAFESLAKTQIAAEESENELENAIENDIDTSNAVNNSAGNTFESRVEEAQAGDITKADASNINPTIQSVSNIVEENTLVDVSPLNNYSYAGVLTGNDPDGDNSALTFAYSGNLDITLKTTESSIVNLVNENSAESLVQLKALFNEVLNNEIIEAIVNNNSQIENLVNTINSAPSIPAVVAIVNSLEQLNIDVTSGEISVTGQISEEYKTLLESNNLLNINIETNGSYTVNSPLFDKLGNNQSVEIKFDYKANDGIEDSLASNISLTVNGNNDAPKAAIVHSIASNDNLDFMYGGQLSGNDVDSNDVLSYNWDSSSVEMTYTMTGLNNLDSLLALNNPAVQAATVELKPVLLNFVQTGNLLSLTSLSEQTVMTSKVLASVLKDFYDSNDNLTNELVSMKDFIVANKTALVAQSTLTLEEINLLDSALSVENLTALETLMNSISTFMDNNPGLNDLLNGILADNKIETSELLTLDPSIMLQVESLRLEMKALFDANESLIDLLDIQNVISTLQEVAVIDPTNGEVSVTTDVNQLAAESMIALDENSGEYTITNPSLNTLPASTEVEVSFNYTVEDNNSSISEESTASILITSDDVDDINVSLSEKGELSVSDNQDINMSDLLANISSNIEVSDIDSIDLSNGEHILSNLTISDFEEMVSDTASNELSIVGEDNDKIKLDLSVWSKDTTDTDINASIENTDDGFVAYSTVGTDSQVLTLLIDKDIIVENI